MNVMTIAALLGGVFLLPAGCEVSPAKHRSEFAPPLQCRTMAVTTVHPFGDDPSDFQPIPKGQTTVYGRSLEYVDCRQYETKHHRNYVDHRRVVVDGGSQKVVEHKPMREAEDNDAQKAEDGDRRDVEDEKVQRRESSETLKEKKAPTTYVAHAENAVPLQKAVMEGQAQLTITGLGGSAGDTIRITVQRKVPETLKLTLAPGTVLRSISGKAQDMVVAAIKGERVDATTYRPATEIVLTDDDNHQYIVEAYCLDFRKANPTSKDRFALFPCDTRSANLILMGKEAKLPIGVIQSALWIDREGVSSSELKRRFPVGDDDIKAARMLLNKVKRSR